VSDDSLKPSSAEVEGSDILDLTPASPTQDLLFGIVERLDLVLVALEGLDDTIREVSDDPVDDRFGT
jgi:hypothetical protein